MEKTRLERGNLMAYNLPFLDHGVKLPSFVIEERHLQRLGLKSPCSDYDFLRALTLEGFNKLGLKKGSAEYQEYVARVKKELTIFNELGFCSYLLITWDIMNYCREHDIATGYGRGSACGSEVLALVGVTKVDAIKNELFFERFLSKFRAKFTEIDGVKYYQGDLLLDIDLDIEFRRRGEVAKYVEERYAGKVCKLLTTSTLTTKILVKDICKSYLEFNEDDAKRVSDMIPKVAGFVSSLANSRKDSKDFDAFCKEHPDFYEICCSLENLHNNFGCHASAWVISADPLKDYLPLQLSEQGELMTGFAMEDIVNMAPKVDLLGLRCATLISESCKKLGIKPENIDIHHESIYRNLQDLEAKHGLFQIEADTNFQVLKKIKPRNLNHLSAVIAIGRPGAIQFSDIFSKYVETGEAQSVHPLFDDILRESAGIPIYQESLMKCANRIGFTLDESETLRRIVGKKKKEEMPEWKGKVEQKIKENNLDVKAGEVLWSILEASANYSFNKSHSAAYASMCAATCYLKFNHPQIFYEVLLNLAKDEPEPLKEIQIIADEIRKTDIKLLPPDITKSGTDFQIEGPNIRFGLSSIRNITDATMVKLTSFKRDFKTKFEIFEAAQEAKININVLTGLILCGCIDSNGQSRTKLAVEAQAYHLLTEREKNLVHKLAGDYGQDLIEFIRIIKTKTDEKGKPYIKESRLDTFRRDFAPYWKMFQENSRHEELATYWLEKHYLGFSYSSTLYGLYSKKVQDLNTISSVLGESKDVHVSFVAVVGEVKKSIGKESKKPYARLELSEETGQIKALISGQNRIDACEQFNGKFPKEGQIVIVHGSKGDGDIVFAESIIIQPNPVRVKKNGEVEVT